MLKSILSPMMRSGVKMSSGMPKGWWHSGSSLDLNFAGNRVFGSPSFASALTVARASTGHAEDEAGNWLPFAANAPRITSKGILIEEARTNSIRNNTMVGAVVGTPGTRPTYWASPGLSGLTQTIVGTGKENGVDYIDIRFNGTSSGTAVTIYFDAATSIAALNGQMWSASVFLKLVDGTLSNVSSFVLNISGRDSGGVSLGTLVTGIAEPGSTLERRIATSTLNNASTAYVLAAVAANIPNGAVIDFTLRIGWPQLELGAFATSPIPTTGGAATRAADVIAVTSPADYASFAQGSMFAEFLDPHGVSGSVNTRGVVGLRADGSNATRLFIEQTTSKVVAPNMAAGAVVAALTSANPTVAGGIYKAACGWQLDDVTGAFSPSLGPMQYDTSAAMPTGSPSVLIGTYTGGGAQLNGYLRRATFFPSALSDARLSELVA